MGKMEILKNAVITVRKASAEAKYHCTVAVRRRKCRIKEYCIENAEYQDLTFYE